MALRLSIGQINQAAKGDNDLRETLTGIYNELAALHQQTGSSPIQKVDRAPAGYNPPPPVSSFSVVGANGQFQISIMLPQQSAGSQAPKNAANAPIWQELSSSPAAEFTSEVQTYPLSTNTSFVFSNPGATLYWRLRSSYDQRTWTGYRRLANPVSSGLASSAASNPNLSLNQSNFATIDSIANGAAATVRIYGPGGPGTSWTRILGSRSEVIPGGTILGAAYGANLYIAWDGDRYQAKSILTETFPDGWVPVGRVSVIANGAGLVLPVFKAVVASGAVVALEIVSAGNGMTAPPAVTITDSSGTGASAQTAIEAGKVVGVTVTNAGSGYSSSPAVSASGGVAGGTGGGGGPTGGNGGRLYGETE